ncbi:hypothetical protein ABZP36_033474 [Zizania latifolia]
MVDFMDQDGLEIVASSMSQGNEPEPQVSEHGAMTLGQPKKTRRRRRRRARTTGTEAGKKNKAPKVKKKKKKPCARDSEGRLVHKKSTPRRKKTAYYTPPRDSKGRFLPKGSTGSSSDTEDNNYNGYMNAQPPDFATVLSIMHGKEGIKYCNRIRRLKDPDFVPLMNVINNSGQETVDEGPYDVLKVLMQADCSVE